MIERIENCVEEHFALRKYLLENTKQIEKAARAIINCYRNNRKVLIFGNGGSAADAQHFASELVGKYKKERKGLPAIALTTDGSALTALSNDYGFNEVFVKHIEALAEQGDVVVGITTSGKSDNVVKGVEKAKQLKAITIVLNGKDGGKLKGKAEIEILIHSKNTPRVQEAHIFCIHMICELVEDALFPDDKP